MGKVILIVILLVIIFCVVENIRELNRFKMTYYDIFTDKIRRDCKVLFFSDMHNKQYGTDNEQLLECARKEKPDIILLGGDMIVGRIRGYNTDTVAFICELSKICTVYYALGNHEQRMKDEPELYGDLFEKYVEEFRGYDVRFLMNETRDILGKNIRVTGLNIPMKAYDKIKKYKDYSVNAMEQAIGKLQDEEKYNILLAHNPTYMHIYRRWNADLILSGHFHGCAVRLPKIGGIITPQLHLFPKYSGGLYNKKYEDIVVSRGLGDHTLKLRLFNIPELIVLNLVKK